MPDKAMNIGQLAKLAGIGIDTIRYYEKQGVLPKPQRLGSGYRRYGEVDLARLEFIRRADRKSTRLNSSHSTLSRMPSSA